VVVAGWFTNLLWMVKTLPLLAPDSLYYYGRALLYAGYSRTQAWEIANALGEPHNWRVSSVERMFDWDLVEPRVVYSALAAPLVRQMGWNGMLVVSIGAALLLYLLMAWALWYRFGPGPALAAILVVLSCRTWFRFAVSGLTESLSALFLALALGAVWLYRRSRRGPSKRWSWVYLVAAATATVLFCFTRQAALIPAAALAAAYLGEWIRTRRWRNSWLAASATIVGAAAACQLVQLMLFPFDQAEQLMTETGASNLGEALAVAPTRLLGIIEGHLRSFAVHDVGMFAAIGLSALALVLCWRRVEVHLFGGAILAGLVYQAANATTRTGLRYCEPGFFIYALVLGTLFAWFAATAAPAKNAANPNG
jgi:chromate transport protein ChrA